MRDREGLYCSYYAAVYLTSALQGGREDGVRGNRVDIPASLVLRDLAAVSTHNRVPFRVNLPRGGAEGYLVPLGLRGARSKTQLQEYGT